MSILTESEIIQDVCRKIRLTVSEFGPASLQEAVIIGPKFSELKREGISDLPFVECETLTEFKLGRTEFKVARFFEDI